MAALLENKHSNYFAKQIDMGVVRDVNGVVRERRKRLRNEANLNEKAWLGEQGLEKPGLSTTGYSLAFYSRRLNLSGECATEMGP